MTYHTESEHIDRHDDFCASVKCIEDTLVDNEQVETDPILYADTVPNINESAKQKVPKHLATCEDDLFIGVLRFNNQP